MSALVAAMAWVRLKVDKENVRLSAASGTWPTVTGQIASVRIDHHRPDEANSSFEPKIDYTYMVADRKYAGTRINFTRLDFARQKMASAVIADYAVGAAAMVAYDPVDPQNSVLDRSVNPPGISFWTIIFFLWRRS
jgi:Protein of unknown function (DUF3592)